MNKPNFHWFSMDLYALGKITLGKKRFDQYKAAYTKTLLGQEFEEPDNENNLPLKTANNRKWNMVAR